METSQQPIYLTKLSDHENDFADINSPVKRSVSFLHTIPTGFHNLPIKFLTATFKYFSVRELQQSIIPVCTHWRYAATRPVLWRKLKLSKNDTPRSFILERIRNLTDIECLHLENLDNLNGIVSQACRYLKNLKHLKLRKCSKLTNSSLAYLLKSHENLETLDLSRTKLEDNATYDNLGYFTNLKSLNLSHVPDLTIQNLMDAVINNHYLEELKISSIKTPKVYLTDDDACFIILKISNTLRSLSIDCNYLTNKFFTRLFDCPQLTRLCLYGAKNITGEILLDFWEYLPQITQFKLRNAHHVTTTDFEEFFSNPNSRQLTVLDLTGCWKLEDKAADIIVTNCVNLESLTLKSCKRITALLKIRESLIHLDYLNLAFCEGIDYSDLILPPKLNTLVVHLDANTYKMLQELSETVEAYVSTSEYNKSMEKWKDMKNENSYKLLN